VRAWPRRATYDGAGVGVGVTGVIYVCIWRVTTRESGGVHGTRKGASGRHTEGAFVRDFSRTRLGGFARARVGRTCGIRVCERRAGVGRRLGRGWVGRTCGT